MRNLIYKLFVSLFILAGSLLTSCNDDETTMSRAVLGSIDVLEYSTESSDITIITLTSDADWVAEAPDWIKVSPMSGSAGQTEVEISVTSNTDGNGECAPRQDYVVFKGRNLRSQYKLLVKQGGDKFRDLSVSSISDIENADDGVTVYAENLVVINVTEKGFVATDGSKYVYFTNPEKDIQAGTIVSVKGDKTSLAGGFPTVAAERMTIGSNAEVPVSEAIDIKDVIGQYDSPVLTTVNGTYSGDLIKIPETKYSLMLTDVPANVKLDDFKGHSVEVEGYYMGFSSNEVNIVVTKIIDKGIAEITYFEEDFEWLAPWAQAGKNGNGSPSAGDTVGDDNPDAESPQISAPGMVVGGITAEKAMLDKGYEFTRTCNSSRVPGECIYLQKNYLKFGKTGYQGGIIFPKMETLGTGVEDVVVKFDWCTQRQGSGKMDPSKLVVIVRNGDTETQFPVPGHGLVNDDKLKWIKAEVTLSGVKVDKNTHIIVRNDDDQIEANTANRWFMDNFKVTKPL